MRKLTTVAALAAAAALAGCGEKTIDSDKAEDFARKVADSGTEKTKSVDCPDDVKAEKGKTFECELEYQDGTKGTLTLHMNDDEGRVTASIDDIELEK